jgi:hypothetical protein
MLRRGLPTLLALLVPLFIALPAQAQAVTPPDCTADVDLTADGGLKVAVVYRCRSSSPVTFSAASEKAAARVMEFSDRAGKPLPRSAASWRVDPVKDTAEAHYRLDLLAYAQDLDMPTAAIARGRGVLTLLEGWLLEPRGLSHLPVIDIRVKAADGLFFASGLPKVGDAWRLQGTPVRFAGYSALGKFTLQEIRVPAPGSLRTGQARQEGVLRLAMLDGFSEQGRADLVDWVRRTAEAESNYWRGFTADRLMLGIVPMDMSRSVGFGRTVSGGGATIMLEVGQQVDKRRLYDQWTLVHELIHTGMPYVENRGTWLMEGAATYVEPIIRARAGWKTEDEVWKEWIEDMPRGAAAFNAGLMNAAGQQNYWGGAIFMLLADIGIRRATKGAKGLEDCLGGVLWSGLDATKRLTVKDFATACDRASDSNIASELVLRHYAKGEPVDLAALWKQLGVAEANGRIVLDDTAPDAEWRKMIVMGPASRPPQRVKLPWQS